MADTVSGGKGDRHRVVDEPMRVLHVDDEPNFAETAAQLLERQDDRLTVEAEDDSTVVLDRLDADDFDCVVSDYDMPEQDGIDLLEAVRNAFPTLPFILYTGKGSEEIASEAISMGVTDYLQKSTGTDQYEVLANRVTNAVAAWRAQRQSERDQQAMNAAWDGISTLDEDGHFTYVNRAYAETFGYEEAALLGEPWTIVYPDDGEDTVSDEILPAVLETGTWTGDTVLERANGESFVGEHTVARIDGGGIACVVRDRTDRRELDRELRHAHERYRLLVEAIDEYAMSILDTEGHVQTWNAGAERIKGYTEVEAVGEHFSTFYPADEREAGLPDRLLLQAREEGVARDEGERVRADGSTFWADVTITPLYEGGALRGYAKVTKDVSEQRERERRLEETEGNRKRLYELTTDPDRTLEQKIVDVLALGADYLDVEHAQLTMIETASDNRRIVAISGDLDGVELGGSSDLSESYCRKAIRSDDILTVANALEQGWSDDPAYERWGLACYLGAKIEIQGEVFGTTCFVDRAAREPFRNDEKVFVELITRWLTNELQQHGATLDWPLEPP